MRRGLEVASGVLSPRVVAAADVTAVGAAPQVHPLPAELQTLDATVPRRGDVADLVEVGAGVSHALSVAEQKRLVVLPLRWTPLGDVAQLARAPALQAGGRGFESHRLHECPCGIPGPRVCWSSACRAPRVPFTSSAARCARCVRRARRLRHRGAKLTAAWSDPRPITARSRSRQPARHRCARSACRERRPTHNARPRRHGWPYHRTPAPRDARREGVLAS